jgi:ribonucleoside-diphosphate reductase alpha chain
VKTTYYLHMKPRHQAEQSTVKVNKAEEISGGARGFAAVGAGSAPADADSTQAAAPAQAPARKGFGFGGLSTGGDK